MFFLKQSLCLRYLEPRFFSTSSVLHIFLISFFKTFPKLGRASNFSPLFSFDLFLCVNVFSFCVKLKFIFSFVELHLWHWKSAPVFPFRTKETSDVEAVNFLPASASSSVPAHEKKTTLALGLRNITAFAKTFASNLEILTICASGSAYFSPQSTPSTAFTYYAFTLTAYPPQGSSRVINFLVS